MNRATETQEILKIIFKNSYNSSDQILKRRREREWGQKSTQGNNGWKLFKFSKRYNPTD